MKQDSELKVAIVHDWLNGLRGGEKVLLQVLELFPEADIFTLFHRPGAVHPKVDERVRKVSFLNSLPFAARYYRHLLPLFPFASRSFDFEEYDLVISLSHAAAKNLKIPQGTPHLCYCFTPMRYLYDQRRMYFGKLTPLLEPILAMLRIWDRKGARSVSDFVGISSFVCERIRTIYGRSANCIFPPVSIDDFPLRSSESSELGEAFLYAGALVPYKRPDLVVRACTSAGLPLWVAGDGPERERLQSLAGPTVKFLGRLSDDKLAEAYRDCKALVYPGVEDFGIMPVECLASGRPVITRALGGVAETVALGADGASAYGIHFEPEAGQSELEALEGALKSFSSNEERFLAKDCRTRAEEYSNERFRREFSAWVRAWLKAEQEENVERETAAL